MSRRAASAPNSNFHPTRVTAAVVLMALAGVLGGPAAFAQADPLLTAAAKEPGAVTTPSGLIFRMTRTGKGAMPAATDTVKVNYRGVLANGTEFDSSYKRNEPASFPLNRVIPCWTEGVQKMNLGAKAKLTCPAAIAYGERGAGGVIPPNATLQFEVELLAINP